MAGKWKGGFRCTPWFFGHQRCRWSAMLRGGMKRAGKPHCLAGKRFGGNKTPRSRNPRSGSNCVRWGLITCRSQPFGRQYAKKSRLFGETFWGQKSFLGFFENSRQQPADLAGFLHKVDLYAILRPYRTDKKFESHFRVPPQVLSTGVNVLIRLRWAQIPPICPSPRPRSPWTRDRGHGVRPS